MEAAHQELVSYLRMPGRKAKYRSLQIFIKILVWSIGRDWPEESHLRFVPNWDISGDCDCDCAMGSGGTAALPLMMVGAVRGDNYCSLAVSFRHCLKSETTWESGKAHGARGNMRRLGWVTADEPRADLHSNLPQPRNSSTWPDSRLFQHQRSPRATRREPSQPSLLWQKASTSQEKMTAEGKKDKYFVVVEIAAVGPTSTHVLAMPMHSSSEGDRIICGSEKLIARRTSSELRRQLRHFNPTTFQCCNQIHWRAKLACTERRGEVRSNMILHTWESKNIIGQFSTWH